MKAIPWETIKNEYITSEPPTTHRELAAKYGVSLSQIGTRASKEKWKDEREQYQSETAEKVLKKTRDERAKQAARMLSVTYKALDIAEMMLERMRERMEDDERDVDPKDIRALSAAMRDIKDLLGVKSELDKQEQEARIAKLRREAEKDDESSAPTLTVQGLPEEFKT